jgi:ABC-type transporter Mla subunit MlaD
MTKKIEAHEALRAELAAFQKSATKLAAAGEKIGGVLARTRDSLRELDERIRYFRRAEKDAPPAAKSTAAKPAPVRRAPAAAATVETKAAEVGQDARPTLPPGTSTN